MAKSMKVIVPILILVGGVVGSIAMFSMKKPPQKTSETIKPLLVDVAGVSKQDLFHKITTQGTVQPLHNTALVSEVNGRIIELSDAFVAGGFFAKDEVLIRIDPFDYRIAVKSAEANLARTQAALQEEKARAKVAEDEWKSFMKGDAPELYVRKPQLARELANVLSAEADLDKARRDLERTTIRAPFDGMIKSKSADIGQFISRGTNLGSFYGTRVAEIRLPLTNTDLAYLELPRKSAGNKPLKVMLSAQMAGHIQQWQGSIVRSEGVVDEKSRVTYVVAQVADPYGLKSGMAALPFGRFVSATIDGNYASDVVKLPRHLLTADQQVLVVLDNKVDLRKVTVLRSDEQYAYITAGLEAGENYVISVIPNPMQGMAVRTSDSTPNTPDSSQETTAIVKADKSL